jgi:hypothetical protein
VEKIVIPFIKNAWPREATYQTEAMSTAFVSLLEDSGNVFPILLDAVRPFMQRSPYGHSGLYRFYKNVSEDDGDILITSAFPLETLVLLDAIVSDDAAGVPHDLEDVLKLIAKTRPDLTRGRRFVRLRELDAAK